MAKKRWTIPKDPDESLDYGIDWAGPLAGDTIDTSTWTVPSGINAGVQTKTATTTIIWFLPGGTDGQDYDCLNHITTFAGRVREQTCTLRVRTK